MNRTLMGLALCTLMGAACGPAESTKDGTGGSGQSGGQVGSGGHGVTEGSGGTSGPTGSGGAESAASGGTTGSGGTASSGGISGSGGVIASGGITGSGGTTGSGGMSGDTGTGGGGSGGNGGSSSGGGGRAGAGATASGGGSAGQGSGGRGGTGGPAATARIMALGDSVTRATCWRAFLWQQLQQKFAGRFDLVGTLSSDNGCNVAGSDNDNQGYSSSLITEAVENVTNKRTCDPKCPAMADLMTAFNTAKPNVLLLHWATNDVWNQIAASKITAAFSTVIDALRVANPTATILLAQIIPMSGSTCSSCVADIPKLNSAITTFAASKSTAQSPIFVVDQYTGFDAAADTRDGVHPNTSGSQKMATRWYEALMANQLVR